VFKEVDMRILICQCGKEFFGINIVNVVQIIPLVHLTKVVGLPDWVIGLCEVNANLIRVVDLCQIIESRPSNPMMHTRIILVSSDEKKPSSKVVGLMAEKVVRTLDFSQYREINPESNSGNRAKVIKKILTDNKIIIQLLDVEGIKQLAGNEQ
jgi:chemotaxis signal transduction protein